MKKRQWADLATASLLAMILVACSDETDLNAKDDAEAVEEKVTQVQEETEKETYNEELTLKVLENANVIKGYVHEENNRIAATLVLKSSVSSEDETTLMKQFADEISAEYPDKNVNVIVTKEEATEE